MIIISFIILYFQLIDYGKLEILLPTIKITETDNPKRIIANLSQELINHAKIKTNTMLTITSLDQNHMEPFIIKKNQLLSVTSIIDRESICPPNIPKKETISYSPNGCVKDDCCKLLGFNAHYDKTESRLFFVLIKILDINDNAPMFDIKALRQPYKEISENAPKGEIIDLPTAIDYDSEMYSVKRYQIRKPYIKGNSEDFQFYQLNQKPYLKVLKLDYEKCNLYEFMLDAYDYHTNLQGNKGSVKIQIAIKDENDNRPKFTEKSYTRSINENEHYDKLIEFKIIDNDSGNNGLTNVQLKGNEDIIKKFQVIPLPKNHGYISLISKFDMEKDPKLVKFEMVVTDSGNKPLSSTASVTIYIQNVNDNAPDIKFYNSGKNTGNSLVVYENTPLEKRIVDVYVTDKDSPLNQIECELVNLNDYFLLAPQATNVVLYPIKIFHLKLIKPLDREGPQGSSLRLKIRCDDKESQPLSNEVYLRIQIGDINDNSPEFSQSFYNGHVAENQMGAIVDFTHRIKVSDKDVSKNGKVIFSINDEKNSTDSMSFNCDRNSGIITTKENLDYETKSNYRFLIVATDQGDDVQLSSTATIVINVDDLNDNAPEFEKSHYSFDIREDAQVGTKIGQVVATDKDSLSENKDVVYSIDLNDFNLVGRILVDRQNQNNKKYIMNYINLNQDTGELTTRKSLDHELFSSLSFQIVAKNRRRVVPPESSSFINSDNNMGGYLFNSKVSVVIKVLNINDNMPIFKPVPNKRARIEFALDEFRRNNDNCQHIPYQIFDKDNGDNPKTLTGKGCCQIRLENDFKGLFMLMTSDDPTLLCLAHQPDRIEPYTITLVAEDRALQPGDVTFKSKISFPVIIKTKSKSFDSSSNNNNPNENGANRGGTGNNGIYGGSYPDNGYGSRSGSRGSNNSGANSGTDSKNLFIIGILVTVVLVFFIIVIIIIIFIKRCAVSYDQEYENPKSNNAGPVSPSINSQKNITYQDRSATILSQHLGSTSNPPPNNLMTSAASLYHPLDMQGDHGATQSRAQSPPLFQNHTNMYNQWQESLVSQPQHYQILNHYHTNNNTPAHNRKLIDYSVHPTNHNLLLANTHSTDELVRTNQYPVSPTQHKSFSSLTEDPIEQHSYQEPLINSPPHGGGGAVAHLEEEDGVNSFFNKNTSSTPNTMKRNYVQTTFV